jgi:hypothetical protein
MVYKHRYFKKPYWIIKVLVGLTVLMAIAGFNTLAHTQNSNSLNNGNGLISFLDPFLLIIITVGNPANLENTDSSIPCLVVTRPPIRIPYKSHYRGGYQPYPESSDIIQIGNKVSRIIVK